jgi:hypothetical protein
MMHGWVDLSPFEGQNLKAGYNLTSVGAIINTFLKFPELLFWEEG